jgi:hypothetical protein
MNSNNNAASSTMSPRQMQNRREDAAGTATTETWSDTAKHAADVVGEQLHKVGVAVGLAEPTLAEKLSQAKEAATRPQTTDTTAAPATSTWTRE